MLIVGEKIAAVGQLEEPADATVVDATGCLLLPGLIDNHTHLSMPFMGMMSSDDYDTGTQAAAAGGVTCLVDFAIQREPDDAAARRSTSGRAAPTAPPTSTTASTWRSPTPTTAAIDDMDAMVEAGVSVVQAVHGLQGRADGARRRAGGRAWSAPATSAR